MNNSLYYRITYKGEGIYNVLKKKVTKEDVKEIIEKFLKNIKDEDAKKEIAFFRREFYRN